MAKQQAKTKSQLSKEGDRKLASGAGRSPKSGGEPKKPADPRPAERTNPHSGTRGVDR